MWALLGLIVSSDIFKANEGEIMMETRKETGSIYYSITG